MQFPQTLAIDKHPNSEDARAFCKGFVDGIAPRYVFGRNEYAASIARAVDVQGFVDDFTDDGKYFGKRIIKTEQLPPDAMVVVVVLGRPLTVRRKLAARGIQQLDYFSFARYSDLDIIPVKFWDQFQADFIDEREKYEWVYSLLSDDTSREQYTKIINFRLSGNLDYMEGFTDSQYRQYFEAFLKLKPSAEAFVDVGGFDGVTSLEFIKRCPKYSAVHVFEPEPKNMKTAKKRLRHCSRIQFYDCGLSNQLQTLKFTASGSTSQISKHGELEIKGERLDDIIEQPFTFLKMDIEGGESKALEGSRSSIIKYHPRLAISVYHRFDDFWRVPQQVFSYRQDYSVFLRHYTEGVDETVMFFMPIKDQYDG